jgi:hypothetical protein
VRVVDAAAGAGGATLWPTDSAGGFPVAVNVEPQRVPPGTGDLTVRQQLQSALADKLAKLFYDWQSDSADGGEEKF